MCCDRPDADLTRDRGNQRRAARKRDRWYAHPEYNRDCGCHCQKYQVPWPNSTREERVHSRGRKEEDPDNAAAAAAMIMMLITAVPGSSKAATNSCNVKRCRDSQRQPNAERGGAA
jgi:hypothetical protein